MHEPRATSIRARLLRNLVTIILVMGLAILATTFLGARRAVRLLSAGLVGQTIETVETRLDAFFSEPSRQLRLTSAYAAGGLLDLSPSEHAAIDDPEEQVRVLRDRRNETLAPIIESYPQISSIMLADGRGREHMLLRSDARWRTRLVQIDTWGSEARWLEWNDGDGAPSDRRETLEYDPRTRPWYQGVVGRAAAQDVYWTKPYTFFTTQQPGITASISYDAGDGIDRVIGFDVPLSDISAFTRDLHVGRRGMVAVLTADRRIIGLPGDPRFDDPATRAASYLKRADDLDLTIFNDAADAFGDDRSALAEPVRFRSGGEPWWGRVEAFELSPERSLWIAIVVPESDLLGSLPAQRFVILGIVLAVLLFAILRARIVARRVSTPIETLVEQSDRISRGDLEPGPSIVSDVTEVQRLVDAQEHMRTGISALLKLEKIERDLDLARDIQLGLLPTEAPNVPGFEIAGWNQPADKTGGDYYDWLTLPDGRFIVTVADVTGHGIGPAMIVAVCRAYVRASTTFGGKQLASSISHVNDLLFEDTPSDRFVTAVATLLDPNSGHVVTVSAGHGPTLFYEAATGNVEVWDGDTLPLGVAPDLELPVPRETHFAPGDVLVLTTDGFFEWANDAGEQFGTARLTAFVREHHELGSEAMIAALYQQVLQHADGTPQGDDLTAVVIKRSVSSVAPPAELPGDS